MTLDEVARIGDLVTESMDENANVIWGARVSDDMKGKIAIMTIMTGVNSPWIIGKMDNRAIQAQNRRMVSELGIEFV